MTPHRSHSLRSSRAITRPLAAPATSLAERHPVRIRQLPRRDEHDVDDPPDAATAGGDELEDAEPGVAEVEAVDTEAAALAATLAAGPTRAYGAMRRMLRQSFETSLSDQLSAEVGSIVAASRSDDAQEGIAAFVAKRRPQFRGE